MYKYYVYLIKSENRLLIIDNLIQSEDYFQLMKCSGNNIQQLISICKGFCLGYITGQTLDYKVKNSPLEFQQ